MRTFAFLVLTMSSPALAADMVLTKTGQKPFTISLDSGVITGATGNKVARIDSKTGIIYFFDPKVKGDDQGKMIGQITGSGHLMEGSVDRAKIDKKDGTIKTHKQELGRIDDAGAIFQGANKWGAVTNCCASFNHKRYVAAFLMMFTNDFLQAPPPPPPPSAPVAGIQINHKGVRWAFIDEAGTITLESGVRAGAIDAAGQVTKDNGIRLGSIAAGGQITKEGGLRVGSIAASGQITKEGGLRAGQIKKDGTIQLESGVNWGDAESCCKNATQLHQVAAALVFFADDFL